jgi:phage terminase large subunit
MFEYTEKQKEALKLTRNPDYREIYLYGGARSSKTFTFLSEIIVRALEAPHSAHCVCRFEQVDCRKTIFDQTLDDINIKMFNSKLLSKTTKNIEGLAFKMKGTTQLRFYNDRLSVSRFRKSAISCCGYKYYLKNANRSI